ncbi:MAG: hypothetical protein KC410_18510 [Anaerolineales bacterium]|nr:hypothetical protein [Anaerolineales bacterium]
MKSFDYSALPFEELVRRYRQGASWRELARAYECPDHKTLKEYVVRLYPDLNVRNHADAQRARREKEGRSRRRSAAEAEKAAQADKTPNRPRWWR